MWVRGTRKKIEINKESLLKNLRLREAHGDGLGGSRAEKLQRAAVILGCSWLSPRGHSCTNPLSSRRREPSGAGGKVSSTCPPPAGRTCLCSPRFYGLPPRVFFPESSILDIFRVIPSALSSRPRLCRERFAGEPAPDLAMTVGAIPVNGED